MSGAGADGLLRLLDAIAARTAEAGVPVRVLGGLAVHLRVPDAPPALQRSYEDLDLVVRRRDRKPVEGAFTAAGLVPDDGFNRIRGHRRQIWWTPEGNAHVDVFVGEFAMCHELSLDERLEEVSQGAELALGAADLLLTKLQIVELNRKDVTDVAALLTTHRVGEGDVPGVIDRGRLQDVLGRDWGFYTTFTDNLAKLPEAIAAVDGTLAASVEQPLAEVSRAVEEAPRSRGFNLRARVGRRKRWYTLPDESVDAPL
jgi:hypothetical protein